MTKPNGIEPTNMAIYYGNKDVRHIIHPFGPCDIGETPQDVLVYPSFCWHILTDVPLSLGETHDIFLQSGYASKNYTKFTKCQAGLTKIWVFQELWVAQN